MSSIVISGRTQVSPTLSGNGVDGDDARTLRARAARGRTAARPPPTRSAGKDRRGLAVAEHGVQAVGVARLVRVEQRHRDGARVDRGEEGDDVVEALRREDRDPVAGLGHLLQPRRDRAQPVAELAPGQLVRLTVALARIVDVAVRQLVRVVPGVLLDVIHQRAILGDAGCSRSRRDNRRTSRPFLSPPKRPARHDHRCYCRAPTCFAARVFRADSCPRMCAGLRE